MSLSGLLIDRKLKWNKKEDFTPLKRPNPHSLSEYLSLKVQTESSLKTVNPRKKSILRQQVEQNKRLINRLSQINKRQNKFIHPDELQSKVYLQMMAERRMRKMKQEEAIQLENDNLVERIVRRRRINLSSFGSHNELSSSSSRDRNRSNKSVLLPQIMASPPKNQ